MSDPRAQKSATAGLSESRSRSPRPPGCRCKRSELAMKREPDDSAPATRQCGGGKLQRHRHACRPLL
ncbi:MAG: hypothetical protein ABL861_02095 [Nitrosomonas sp.]